MSGYKGETLKITVETFFDYGITRINMISQLIDIDINLKKLQLKRNQQKKTIERLTKTLEDVRNSVNNPLVAQQRLMFKSDLIESFRGIESDALEYLYLQAASYR